MIFTGKVFALFREGKSINNTVWKSESMAIAEMQKTNTKFKKYNEYFKNDKSHPPIKLVEVKPITFNRKRNLDL